MTGPSRTAPLSSTGRRHRTGPPSASGRCPGGWRRRGPLLPALIFTIIVTQMPFLVTLVISTFSWNILRPGEARQLRLAEPTTSPSSPTPGCATR